MPHRPTGNAGRYAPVSMNYKPIRWASIAPGDRVRLRPKRASGDRVVVTVARLLDRSLADGCGFVDDAGVTFRQFYYDVELSVRD